MRNRRRYEEEIEKKKENNNLKKLRLQNGLLNFFIKLKNIILNFEIQKQKKSCITYLL